jgi:hypothetical protein
MANPQQAVTLTKSVFDVADCNIAQRYFNGDTDDPLPFSGAAKYNALYSTLVAQKTMYADLRQHDGAILKELRSAYSPNKFWQRYLRFGVRNYDERRYAKTAWEELVPVAAVLKRRIEVVLPAGLNVQVRPQPRVLLYPFGWSTWISFQIDGKHSLEELATLTTHLLEGAAYRLEGEAGVVTLQDVFGIVGKGVSEDAFDGNTFNAPEILSVVTVLGKHGGGPSLGAPKEEEVRVLKRLIRMDSDEPLKKLILKKRGAGESEDTNFILYDDFSWFLWAEHRLKPFERNAQSLRCYHNNIVRSLVQVWLLHRFFAEAARIEPWSATVTDLVKRALRLLKDRNYKNLSMVAFLDLNDFPEARTEVQKRVDPQKPKGG